MVYKIDYIINIILIYMYMVLYELRPRFLTCPLFVGYNHDGSELLGNKMINKQYIGYFKVKRYSS